MRPIFIIAENTFRELVRDRILHGILVFAFLLFLLSIVLGQLSFVEQARISADFGFSAIQLSAATLAIFIGSTLVRREMEKKTIFTVLARPINRSQFLLGKAFGLLSVVFSGVALLAFALVLILLPMKLYPDWMFLLSLYGVLLESAVLLSFTIFFGSFASPTLTVSFVIGIFLIGHSVDSLKYFLEKSSSESFFIFGKAIIAICPNFELFNWRGLFVYNESIGFMPVVSATAYAFLWWAALNVMAAMIFNRRDLG